MDDLMFPKKHKKKHRRKHKESIIQPKDGGCYLCERLHSDYGAKETEAHHVYFGCGRREISEAEGFKVYLCRSHHQDGPEAVHRNHETCLLVQQDVQKQFEKRHSRQEFMDLVGRSYL